MNSHIMPRGRQADFVYSLFGKPFEVLTCTEVCEKLEAVSESTYIEFKESFTSVKEMDRELLRAVVGFLNMPEGYGLLVLGVKDPGKPGRRVVCLPKSLFEWGKPGEVEAHIRDTILGSLKSIPRAVAPPRLDVKVFNCRSDCGLDRDGWLILVYVERASDAVYYSKVDNTAYIRRANATQQLSLEEVLALVESKRKPAILVLLEPLVESPRKLRFAVTLMNIGYKPAMHVTYKLYINTLVTSSDQQRAVFIESIKPDHKLAAGSIQKEGSWFTLQLFHIYPIHIPAYPQARFNEGALEIMLNSDLPEQATITFRTHVLTEETVTEEQGTIEISANAKPRYQLSVEVKDYLGNTLLRKDNWSLDQLNP